MRRAAALVAVALILTMVWAVVAPPAAAGAAHAQVVRTAPADGAVVSRPPHHVAVYFAAKPVTAEGDPLAVYAADGHRVDTGEVHVDEEASALEVELVPGPLPRGRYEVVYRVISGDTHLVAGQFSFRSDGGAGSFVHEPADAAVSHPPRPGCADCRLWAVALSASGAGAALVGSLVRRRLAVVGG